MRKIILIAISFYLVISLSACTINQQNNNETELVVSAAASLTDALEEIKKAYERENSEIKITYNLGSSGKLAQQIEQGAPVDVYLSASSLYMNQLDDKNLIYEETRTTLASNEMVLITNKNNPININSFEQITREFGQIAIGNPESVPAGKYAKDILLELNIWDELQNKLVYAKDDRQVLTYVESDNVELGIVYYSDTLITDKIRILAKADPDLHEPIEYTAAVVKYTKNKEQAKDFLDFLSSEEAKEIFKRYGLK